jgi:hypothetical protein
MILSFLEIRTTAPGKALSSIEEFINESILEKSGCLF